MKIYPSQTKILDGRTNVSECFFEALFKGVSTRFGLRTIENPFENQEVIFCSFFQNLRLGSIKLQAEFMLPKRRFWNPDFRSTFQWFVAQIEYSRP